MKFKFVIFFSNILIKLKKYDIINFLFWFFFRERYKRQYYGVHGSFSLFPFLHLSWGGHHHNWYSPGFWGTHHFHDWHSPAIYGYGHGWGTPWVGRFASRRRSWKREWNTWNGHHEGYSSHESFHEHHPWHT